MAAEGTSYWGQLINVDKSPAPPLEQLCFGIAGLVSTFDSSFGTTDLTPDRLAAFYRQVGGNYDRVFLGTPSSSLSFIYQSLGCYHSLQPTADAFKPPSIPALLPSGFVRWLTIQIVLDPDEHHQFLQNAISQWDFEDIDGNTFPKVLPRAAFPPEPDPGMVEWHESVSRRFELDCIRASTPGYSPPMPEKNVPPPAPEDLPSAGKDYFSYRPHPPPRFRRSSPRTSSDADFSGDAPHRHRHYDHRSGNYDYRRPSRADRMPRESPPSRRSSISPQNERPSRSRGRRPNMELTSQESECSSSSEDSETTPPRPFFSDLRHNRRRRSQPHHLSPGRSHSHDATHTRRPKMGAFRDHPRRYDVGDMAHARRRGSPESDSSSESSSTPHSYRHSGYTAFRPPQPRTRQHATPGSPTFGPATPPPSARPYHHPRQYITSLAGRYFPSFDRHTRERRDRSFDGHRRSSRSANYPSAKVRPSRYASPTRARASPTYYSARGVPNNRAYVGHGRRANWYD